MMDVVVISRAAWPSTGRDRSAYLSRLLDISWFTLRPFELNEVAQRKQTVFD